MDLNSFKDMLGILGNFAISERMFKAIDLNKDNYISLEDYLIYNDILMAGSNREKNEVTYRMIDTNSDGAVNFEEFQTFWTHFLQLYGETLQTKL